ncbi:hypothetical protein MKX01_010597 [Papaver californicum]|nr:hypothetical protein MKX01_010597 [Papaver californicum]
MDYNDSRRFGIINLVDPLFEPLVVKPVTSNNTNMKNYHHNSKFQVKYKECMKNNIASIGGHADDACREFMQEGDENNNNNAKILRCVACGCHNNFHRKEIHGNGFVDHLQQQPILIAMVQTLDMRR